MKNKKEFNLLGKIRSAMRNIWRYSPSHRNAIKAANHGGEFMCPHCAKSWPIQLATPDHEPPLGSFTLETLGDWTNRLFYGPVTVVCKPCHSAITKKQRKSKLI